MKYKLVLTWKDQDGNSHRKEYDDEKQARKARNWLEANGAKTTDIAIKLPKANNGIIEPTT